MKKIATLILIITAAAFLCGLVFCGCARNDNGGPKGETDKPDSAGSSAKPADETPDTEEPAATPETTPEPTQAMPHPVLVIDAGGTVFYATFDDNGSAHEFAERLNIGAITVQMHDYGGFVKVGDLPWLLPRNDREITTEPGDVILYQGDQITIYYGENTWEFTKLAHIDGATKEGLLKVLGEGDVAVKFSVEWRT